MTSIVNCCDNFFEHLKSDEVESSRDEPLDSPQLASY